MPLPPSSQVFVDDFLRAFERIEKGYVQALCSYIAIKAGEKFEIIQARLFLGTATFASPQLKFQSPNVRAGRFLLSWPDPRLFIEELLSGSLTTPNGAVHFTPQAGSQHGASFVPFHPDGLRTQVRYNVLSLFAGPVMLIHQPDIDWEIKAASVPYDGLQELANELGLGGGGGPTATVEVMAFNVGVMDANKSLVTETSAIFHILMAAGLEQEKVSLAYRIYVPGEPTRRGTILGSEMQWSEEAGSRRAQKTIEVPVAAVINCTVVYDGMAQSHLWISDPNKVQNPRRAAYEAFDPKLEGLRATIENASLRRQDARQLEPAVAWLIWMLGFSTAHLGGTPRTTDAADIVAVAAGGNFAVIECTTGLLKEQSKLALLHARAQAVRDRLNSSNNTMQRVLPVIVTSKTLAEVRSEIEAAERLGILVITREGLEQSIHRTLVQPNSDQIYAEAEKVVSAAFAKYATQAVDPLAAANAVQS